jgi:folate-binding protein YgfZ
VQHFGDRDAEYRALTGPAAVTPLLAVGSLRLTGADRLDFLHGQVSNEVRGLQAGETNTALLLNVKGHALAQLQVYRRADDLFVAVDDGAALFVEAHLKRHIIFDQVELQNLTGTLTAMTLGGAEAAGILKEALGCDAPRPGRFVEPGFASAKVLVAPQRRTGHGGYDLYVLERDAAALFAALQARGAKAAGEEALELSRVASGIPKAASEAGEGVLPQEAGLDFAVSYRKGCYLGQEIMARVEARGKLRRSLFGLRYNQRPEEGAKDVLVEGKTVGRRGDAVDHPALGPLSLAVLRNDLAVEATLHCGGATAKVTPLPFEAP